MYRHNYPDHPHPRARHGGSRDHPHQEYHQRPGSSHEDNNPEFANIQDQDYNNFVNDFDQSFDSSSRGHDRVGLSQPGQAQLQPRGSAPPLMSLQVNPGPGDGWQNNQRFGNLRDAADIRFRETGGVDPRYREVEDIDPRYRESRDADPRYREIGDVDPRHRDSGDDHPSSSSIRYRSRSPEHRLVNKSFSPGVPTQGLNALMPNINIHPTSDPLPDKVYECLGLVVLVQDFLECGVIQLRGAEGRTANCLFFRKDVLVHARRERMSLETPQNTPFKANAWMMNRDWPIPYLAASVWLDGADIPPIAMSKIFQPPDPRTVELYQTLANDLAWQIPNEPPVHNPMFAPPEVARRNVVLVDEEMPPIISPARKVVLVEGAGAGARRGRGGSSSTADPMRQLRDSIRSVKHNEIQRSWSPMSQLRESVQTSGRADIPVVNIDAGSPPRFQQKSRSPRRRSRSRSKRMLKRSRSPKARRSPKRRSRSPRKRSRSPRKRSPRRRSRSTTRSARKSRSRSPKKMRSRSRDRKEKLKDSKHPPSSRADARDAVVMSKACIQNGAAAKVKSFINDEIGILTLLPGWKDQSKNSSNQPTIGAKSVYFHVDQVWIKTSSIGLHQFREIYPTKELKKRFPVDKIVWCNVRKIKSEEADYQAVVICAEVEYEEWKQKVNQTESFLNHSLEYNFSVIQYMETRKRECILNPFPVMKIVTVEAKVHEYFSLDVGFLKLCGGDAAVVLFHTNQVIIPTKVWTRLKHSLQSDSKSMKEHLPLGMSVQVVLYQLPCHGCSQLRYQAQAVYKTSYDSLEDPIQDFQRRYGRLKEKLELKKSLDQQFDAFKKLTKLENSSWNTSFVPVHAVLNGLPQGWQAVVVAVVNREFGIIRVSRTDGQSLCNEQGMAPTVLHVLFHIEDVYDVHGYKMTASNMNLESLTDEHVDLTARTICKRNKPAGIFDVQHKLALESASYVGIPVLQAIVVCVKMNASSTPVTRSVPKPTVLRKEPGNFDSEVSAYYLQYGLKVKLDIKVVQFVAIKNKPSLPYQQHMLSNYSFRDEKEVLEGLKAIDSEASQQIIYGKLNMKDIKVPTENLPLEISRIECSVKFLYRSNLVAEKGIVEIKPLVDRQAVPCLAYFQYSDLYKQQEQDFQCKDLALLMPVSSKDKFCVSVHLWKPGYQVPYMVTVVWNETLRLRLAMPEPRPAPCSPEYLSYRGPLVKEIIASCQDEIEVVTDLVSAKVKQNENPGSIKIKIPAKAGKAAAGLSYIYQDFVSLETNNSIVEHFDSCKGVIEKVIGEHYLIIDLSEQHDSKKIRVLATSADIIASYDPESLDSVTKVSNAKAAHTGINLYDLAKPGDNVRLNAVLLAADNSTIQYCATCVVIDPKRYMAKLVVPTNPEELLRPLPLPSFVPLLPVKSSKPFGNLWKETYQKIVSSLDGNLDIEGSKLEIVPILSTKAPNKCSGMDLRPCHSRETKSQPRISRSVSTNSETGEKIAKDGSKEERERKRPNLIYVPTSTTTTQVELVVTKSEASYDPYRAKKIYGRVIKILNPNYGIGICQFISKDGICKTVQVLFDIFDVWIDDQVVAKMNKKLPEVMVVGDYLQMLCIKVEACEGLVKRSVEHMATAVAVAKSYEEVKTKGFPSAVVPLERIDLIDDSKIDNFRKVVNILKGMEPDAVEKRIIKEVGEELRNKVITINKVKDKVKDKVKAKTEDVEKISVLKIKDDVTKTNECKQEQTRNSKIAAVEATEITEAKCEPPKKVFSLGFKSDIFKENVKISNEGHIPVETPSDSVISIFTVRVLKNIEGSFWLGYTTNEMTKKCDSPRPKRVLINTTMLEKNLLVEEGMILNCDISEVVVEDPIDTNQVYHIAKSVKLNPIEEIILDDKRWKEKTKMLKYKPIVESIYNVEYSKQQCRQLLGEPNQGEFCIGKGLPDVLINKTGVVLRVIDESSAIIRLAVEDNIKRKIRSLQILADNEFRSDLDQAMHKNFSVGYPVTFHAIKLEGKGKDVQYVATHTCLHLDPKRYEEFVGCGNKDTIESVFSFRFPAFNKVKKKLEMLSPDHASTRPDQASSCSGVVGQVRAVDEEIILIEHTDQKRRFMSMYFKKMSERIPKTMLVVKEGQEIVFNHLYLSQESIGLATQIWFPEEDAKEDHGCRDITVETVQAFKEKVSRITSTGKLQHLIPRNFIKLQSKYNEEDLSRLATLYVGALEEILDVEGVKIPAPLSFQNIVSKANFEMTPKDAREFLILLGDICQESIGPKKEAFWDIALDRDLMIGDIQISSRQALIIKDKGLTNAIKLLPRTRKNLLSWRYPEEWVKTAEKYSSCGIDENSFTDCPQGWSRVDDSKLLAGALEHGLLFQDCDTEKSWASFADDLGYGLGSRIFKEGDLQSFVTNRLSFLRRVSEGRGRFSYGCEEVDNSLLICNVATIKDEIKLEDGIETGKSPSLESLSEEETFVVKEEYFEVDDALALPHHIKVSTDEEDMEKNLSSALEEMERAAALIETSYESELGDQETMEI